MLDYWRRLYNIISFLYKKNVLLNEMALFPKILTILFGPNWASWSLGVISTLGLFLTAYPESISIIENEYWQRTTLQLVQFLFTVGVLKKSFSDTKKVERIEQKLQDTEEVVKEKTLELELEKKDYKI